MGSAKVCDTGDELETLDDEIDAFRVMHEELFARIPGQYVAVYQGQLVDHDTDLAALYLRIQKKYPDVLVLIRELLSTPDRDIVVRSLGRLGGVERPFQQPLFRM